MDRPLLRGAPRLGLALGPASARAGPDNQHRDLRECQRFVPHVELRRLVRQQTAKKFRGFARIFVYMNEVRAVTCLDNILMI